MVKYKNVSHNTLKIRLFDLLQEEKVKFIDQFGVIHDVYDASTDFLYMETPYYYKTKNIALQGNYNKCVDNASNKEKFKPLCENKSIDMVSRLCEKCANHSKASVGYEYSTFDGVLIPDISTGANDKYKYWIEVVHSHPSTDLKRKIIHEHKINCIEVSLNALYDGYYEDDGVFVIDCYYITNLNNKEYEKVKNALKIESKIYMLKIELEDTIDLKFTKKPFSRFNLNYSKRQKSSRDGASYNLVNHPHYRKITFTEEDFKREKEKVVQTQKKERGNRKPRSRAIYNDFFESKKEFFDKMTEASKEKGISYQAVCEYLFKEYKKDNTSVDNEVFSKCLMSYVRRILKLVVMNGESDYYSEEYKNKYSIPHEPQVIISKELFETVSGRPYR